MRSALSENKGHMKTVASETTETRHARIVSKAEPKLPTGHDARHAPGGAEGRRVSAVPDETSLPTARLKLPRTRQRENPSFPAEDNRPAGEAAPAHAGARTERRRHKRGLGRLYGRQRAKGPRSFSKQTAREVGARNCARLTGQHSRDLPTMAANERRGE